MPKIDLSSIKNKGIVNKVNNKVKADNKVKDELPSLSSIRKGVEKGDRIKEPKLEKRC